MHKENTKYSKLHEEGFMYFDLAKTYHLPISIPAVVAQSPGHVWFSVIPWTSTNQAWSVPKFMSFAWPCHPDISSFDALFSFCPQSFSASGTFPMSQLFISGDQNTGVLASASVLPLSIQAWFLLRWTGRENGKPTQYTCRRDLMYCIKRTFAVAEVN